MKPTRYTKELSEQIISELLEGKSLRRIAKELGVMANTVLEWVHKHEDFKERYLLARLMYAEFVFDEILEIADSPANDYSEVKKQQLQIDSRKWVLGKMNPKRYGKQLTIDDISASRPKQLVIVTTDKDIESESFEIGNDSEQDQYLGIFDSNTLRIRN